MLTSNDLRGHTLYQIKNLCLHNVSIYINFHQNKLINEYAKENLAKITEFQNYEKTELRKESFFCEI